MTSLTARVAVSAQRYSKPYHRVRDVRLLQGCDLLSRKLDFDRGNSVVEMVQLGGADDRCGNHRLRQEPRERNLCAWDATGFGHLGDAISDFLVGFPRLGE